MNKLFVKSFFDFGCEKAQSGAVFRLLIDAIIGLLILVIIVSALGFFESLRVDVSKTELLNLVKSASESPDGSVLVSNNLVFVKGQGFSNDQFQAITNYAKECFEFQTNLHSISVISDGVGVEFKQNVDTKVFAKCVPSNDECEINCVISFGKKLESNE